MKHVMEERKVLEAFCREYSCVYYYDLKTDLFEILKLDLDANAVNMLGKTTYQKFNYSEELKYYCEKYVMEKEQEEFMKILSRDSIACKLSEKSRFVYRYQSKVNLAGQSYFEVRVIRVAKEEDEKTALVTFRCIDDEVRIEKQHEQELKTALETEEKTKRLERERKDAIASNEMKSRFLSSISHDLRTPINGIQGMLRIADTYPNDMKKQSECREKLWVASNYLVSLVNNVLDMNRLENKAVDLTEQPFNLIDLLMSITAMNDMQIKAQGLHSIVDWKPGYIKHRYLIGSAEGISRILMNLNSNAIKYNKQGGTIYCRCMEKECDGDTVWIEFVTEDTGVGMDEEFLKHAFEPYVQEHNDSLNSINGVGLGLSIVKQTVELMGGTLQVESKINKGTRFTTMLPLKIDSNPHIEKKNFEYMSLKGIKALLVEDNDLNMEIAKFHLEQEEVNVYTAVNGQEAVDMFAKSEVGYYDIILMDIMMPIMDGLEATRRIREMNRADALVIPIIAMSANAFEEDIEKSLQAGMNEHLTKPMDGQKITDTMKKYLANKIQ